jgi:hypothetical protein
MGSMAARYLRLALRLSDAADESGENDRVRVYAAELVSAAGIYREIARGVEHQEEWARNPAIVECILQNAGSYLDKAKSPREDAPDAARLIAKEAGGIG